MRAAILQIFFAVMVFQNAFSQSSSEGKDRLIYARHLLDSAIRNHDSLGIAEGYYLLAKHEMRMTNFNEAYRLFHRSLQLYSHLKQYYEAGKIYLRLSELELERNNKATGKYYIQEAFRIFRQHKLDKGLKSTYELAGYTYRLLYITNRAKADFDSAMYYYRKLEQIAKASANEKQQSEVKFGIGMLYLDIKDPRAIPYLEYAVKVQKKQTPESILISFQTTLAEAYLTFNQPSKAKEILEESQAIIDSAQIDVIPVVVSHHYNIYAEYYKLTGNWEKAYQKREKGITLMAQQAENDRNGHISRWRVQMETEKKDAAIKMQTLEIENKLALINQQQLFMALVVLFAIVLAVLSYLLYKNYHKQKALSRKNAILVQEQSHRLKNNLQVISSMLNLQVDYLNDLKDRKVFSESLSRIDAMVLLHSQLYENDDAEYVNIKDLLSGIAGSAAHTFGVFEYNLQLNISQELLKTDLATSLGLIMNELLINSFKYAFTAKVPELAISMEHTGQNIDIAYRDFGNEDLSEIFRNPEKKGFGLSLIDMILSQLNGLLSYTFDGGSVFRITFQNQ